MSQYVEIESTAAQYLEFMIHGFMNGLVTLQELEASAMKRWRPFMRWLQLLHVWKIRRGQGHLHGLTAYAPYTAHYWRALGAVNQQMKDYTEAIAHMTWRLRTTRMTS